MKMEWTEDHEVGPTASSPELCGLDLMPALRTVESAKIWQYVDRK